MQTTIVRCGAERLSGRLVFVDDILTAVLTRLVGKHYGEVQGYWFLETSFGSFPPEASPFATIEDAMRWISDAVVFGADRNRHPNAVSTPRSMSVEEDA